MDFNLDFGVASVAVITVIVYYVADVVKATKLDNKWIPVICGFVGACLGVAGIYLIPDFPAKDYISAAAIGIVSGLAATGGNQILKQLKAEPEDKENA